MSSRHQTFWAFSTFSLEIMCSGTKVIQLLYFETFKRQSAANGVNLSGIEFIILRDQKLLRLQTLLCVCCWKVKMLEQQRLIRGVVSRLRVSTIFCGNFQKNWWRLLLAHSPFTTTKESIMNRWLNMVSQFLSTWNWDACRQFQHAEGAPNIVKIGIFADTFSVGAAGDWFSGPSSLFGAISHLPYISTSPPLSLSDGYNTILMINTRQQTWPELTENVDGAL